MTDQALLEALRSSRLGTELSADQAGILVGHLAFRDLAPEGLGVDGGRLGGAC